jgi:DNA-binding NtrC family response regulator
MGTLRTTRVENGPAVTESQSLVPAIATSRAPSSQPPNPGEHWPNASVLVVDGEVGIRDLLARTLADCVGRVLQAGTAREARELLARHRFNLAIIEIALPDATGIGLLKELRASGHAAEVILITAYADVEIAIEALRAGASDFLLKPVRAAQVLHAVRHGLERAQLKRENWLLKRVLSQHTPPADGLVGQSIVVKGLQAALRRVSAVDSTVLLTGESGTGKELAALALHRLSGRHYAPFVPLSCASANAQMLELELFGGPGRDGLIVGAQGSTLFLDEVTELPMSIQASLLRVLEGGRVRPFGSQQETSVDVRIVAATSRPLRAEVDAGRFRPDLFYRLQVAEIAMPPLRAHKEDIPDLVAHFVATLAPRLGVGPIEVSPGEMTLLKQYDWPGNVRELRNLIERSLIVGALNVTALYRDLAHGAGPSNVMVDLVDLATVEKRHILAMLESVDGDRARAARLLRISRRTLERRIVDWAATRA